LIGRHISVSSDASQADWAAKEGSTGPLAIGLDAREVLLARITRGMTGILTSAEARKMVLEKQSAGIRAQLAYARALLDGDPAAANPAFFDVYHRDVQSNRKRLHKRWWRLIAWSDVRW
jgi:hypothetical protein